MPKVLTNVCVFSGEDERRGGGQGGRDWQSAHYATTDCLVRVSARPVFT